MNSPADCRTVPMALCSFRPLGLLLFTMFIASARATANGKPPALALVPPPAGSRFLWTCCANTTNASVCYDSLLPFAGSFHGNCVRVARAAAIIAFARVRGFYDEIRRFYDEIRRLQPGGTGAGRLADMALGDCAMFAEAPLGREGDALDELRRLETAAGRRRGERAEEEDLHDANLAVSGVPSCTVDCIDGFASEGDKVLASPVVKKVVAWAADVRIYGDIALDLVASIQL